MADEMNVSIVVTTNGAEKLKPVATGIRDIGTAVSEGGLALERFGDQAASLGQSVDQIGVASRRAGGALPGFYEGAEQAGLKAGGAERGMRRMEFALTAISLQSMGAQTGLMGAGARMAEASLLFGYGSQAVVGIGAGFAAFGLTLKAITAPMEEVEKDAAGITKEFDKLTTSLHPGAAAMSEVLTVAQQLQKVQEDAEPTTYQQIFGLLGDVVGLSGVGLNGIQDQIDAQEELAHAAEATANSLKPELDRLVAIGQTKDLLRAVAAQLHDLGAIGGATTSTTPESMRRFGAGAGPGQSLFDAPGQVVGPPVLDTTVTGTGLIGAQQKAVAQARGMGWAKDLTDATVESIDRDFVGAVGKALKTAGDNLTPLPVLDRMAESAANAVRASGLPRKIVDELVAEIRAQLLAATELMQRATGPGVAGASVLRFTPPPPLFGGSGRGLAGFEGARPDTGLFGGLQSPGPVSLSAVNNLKALDDGAVAARKFAEETNKAANKVQTAGEKFEVTLTRSIGDAVIMMTRGRSVSGVLAGASSVMGTFAQQRFTDADEMESKGANVAGSLKMPGLALPATIMSIGAGLISGLGDLFKSGISIKDYGPVALEQLRALMVQGGLVSMNITSAGGMSSMETANLINRQTSRDAVPRFPTQPVGAGR